MNDCGEARVNKQVLVSFSIGKYSDEMLCDVVPMLVRYLLLGRLEEFNRRATKNGYANRYSFVSNNRVITLAPHTPKQVYEDQLKMKRERGQKEIELKSEKNELEKNECEVKEKIIKKERQE